MQLRLPRVHYAWIIIGLSVLLYLAGGSITQAFGVVILPLQDEYGWSQGSITLAYGISAIVSAVLSPMMTASGCTEADSRRCFMPKPPRSSKTV